MNPTVRIILQVINGETMEIVLSKELYTKEVILKTIYLYHDRFTITIDSNEKSYTLEIGALKKDNFNEAEFLTSLQEQQLRELLNEQFGKLREAIYQKAFSLVE